MLGKVLKRARGKAHQSESPCRNLVKRAARNHHCWAAKMMNFQGLIFRDSYERT